MSDDREEVWMALLGPPPVEPPLEDDQDPDVIRTETWVREDEAPFDGLDWLRWNSRDLDAAGWTVRAGDQLRLHRRRTLGSGEIKTFAFDRITGVRYPISREIWDASGEGAANLWWSGMYTVDLPDGPTRLPIYVQDPPAPPVLATPTVVSERASDLARKENTDLKLIYGLARIAFKDDADGFGTAAEIARDLEAMGLKVSRDTVAQRLRAGQELYDPVQDATRNPNSDSVPRRKS